MAWTTATLLRSVKLKAMAPTLTGRLEDSDILQVATEELWGVVNPLLLTAAANFFEVVHDVTYVDNGDGSMVIPIPHRAIGGKLSLVVGIDASGQEWNIPVVSYYEPIAKNYGGTNQVGQTVCFTRNENLVVRRGASQALQTVRIIYYLRPGELVETSACAQVLTIGGSSFTISQAVSGLSTGVGFDVISNVGIYPYVALDQTGTVAGTTITMTPPTGMAEGDWIALAGQSPIPGIPLDLHPAFSQLVTARVLEILGDSKGMMAADAKAQIYISQFMNVVAPRVDKTLRKIVNPNSQGPFLPWGKPI